MNWTEYLTDIKKRCEDPNAVIPNEMILNILARVDELTETVKFYAESEDWDQAQWRSYCDVGLDEGAKARAVLNKF